ncbi:hypothetical protein MKW98_004130, partial [Papaver atlanticum]
IENRGLSVLYKYANEAGGSISFSEVDCCCIMMILPAAFAVQYLKQEVKKVSLRVSDVTRG